MLSHPQRAGERVRQVMEIHGPMIYRLAYARTLNRSDAEDVFQEVMLRLMQRGEPFESTEHEKAWLIRVTCNLSIRLVKSAWRRHTAGEERMPPVDEYERSLGDEALSRAMMRLNRKYRAPIHLFYFEELSVEEIARILMRKPSTVRAQLTRGRDKLKQLLTEGGFEEWT
jgi:RNA polymerase sigma-70 factor (ECF subfamily)